MKGRMLMRTPSFKIWFPAHGLFVEWLPADEDVVRWLSLKDLFKFRFQVFRRCDPCIRSFNVPLLGISLLLDPVTQVGVNEFLERPSSFALGAASL